MVNGPSVSSIPVTPYHGAMLQQAWNGFADLIARGGWVMYPLIALSIVAFTLMFERMWFWLATNNPMRTERYHRIAEHLREGRRDRAAALVQGDRSVYGRLVERLLADGPTDAVVTAATERERPRLERFMPSLGTIITAAPLMGILGTVTGIIASFRVLSDEQMVTDPSAIGAGIAEALLTTVVGLIIALLVLFPFNAFRAQIDRTLGRMETLVAAARQEQETGHERNTQP